MLRHLLLATLACLLRRSSTACPSITDLSGRQYQTGDSVQVWCTDRTDLFYVATCQASGLWDHSSKDTQCGQQAPPPPYVPPPVTVQPAPTFVAPATSCMYIPEFMNEIDSDGFFPEGFAYRMRCQGGAGTFIATCTRGAWAYAENPCSGQTVTSLFDRLGNLFRPIFNPRPADGVVYRDCPFLPQFMFPADSTSTFPHRSQYRLDCTGSGYPGRYIYGTCNDGNWQYDVSECSRENIFQNFANILGNLFRPITRPPQEPLKPCAFLPRRMRATDRGRQFRHNSYYQFECSGPRHRGRYYWGTCRDGRWDFSEDECDRPNAFRDIGRRFNNLFGFQGDYPWWILLG